ncbi:hypothetical protein CCAX7_15930 [Capsulimonas corticalis]|uniref:Uncharacterized protein n=2 Tax=Capsulimonas corticalis TaxID=2219043 RepID=A0A402CZ31_9BACT|nr:hypothetical protein CCAX7_15930 [Capsulimonas corticalis]
MLDPHRTPSVIVSDTATEVAARPVDARLRLSVFQVARTSYRSLNAAITHPHWAISHVALGDVRTTTADRAFAAPAGSVLVHPPGLPYVEYAPGPGQHEWIVFDAITSQNIPLFEAYPLSPVIALSCAGAYSEMFEELLSAWSDVHSPPFQRELAVSRRTAAILDLLIEEWRKGGAVPRPASMAARASRFAATVAFMMENAHRRLSRGELAERECLHPGSLDRLFRAEYGMTPMRMLTDIRLRRARELLAATDRTLDAIASECGFEDATYLIRVFKSAFGATPGRYRDSVRSAHNLYSE